jgi:acyl carrier protein
MAVAKKWKQNWELKSLTQKGLLDVIVRVITKQLDDIEKDSLSLESDLIEEFEADSVDIVAMLLYLEDMFKNASSTTRTVVPTDKLNEIIFVEDLFDIMYEVLLGIESKMETFVAIQPDFGALEKRQKMGELYPKSEVAEV